MFRLSVTYSEPEEELPLVPEEGEETVESVPEEESEVEVPVDEESEVLPGVVVESGVVGVLGVVVVVGGGVVVFSIGVVVSAEEPSVHVPSDGLGNDSSLAADSSLANEAVCQDSGDAEFVDPRKPTIDSENLDPFEGEAPDTLFAIHFDFWRSVKYAVYPATLYVYSYEAIR